MDKGDFEILTKLNSEQSRNIEKLLEAKDENDTLRFKGIQKNIEAGFEAIRIEMNHHNGRLKEVEEHTTWWRYFQRNPKKTVFILLVFIIGSIVLMGYDVNGQKIIETIKNLKFW